MNTRTHETYWVCVDCFYAHHGIDDDNGAHGIPSERPTEPLSLIPSGASITSGLVYEEHAEDCPQFDHSTGEYLGYSDRIPMSKESLDGILIELSERRDWDLTLTILTELHAIAQPPVEILP